MGEKKPGRLGVPLQVYVTDDQRARLDVLKARTRVPTAARIRMLLETALDRWDAENPATTSLLRGDEKP